MGQKSGKPSRPLTAAERDALVQYFEANSAYLHYAARLFLMRPEDEEDLIQDCLLQIIRHIDTFLSFRSVPHLPLYERNITMKHILKKSLSLCLALLLLGALLPLPGARAAESYSDVSQGAWYASAVRYVTKLGLFKGVAPGVFGPGEPMDRAMAVTVLWRLAGKPAAKSGAAPFEDVPPKSYYAAAVAWAAERGIVRGLDSRHFAPRGEVSRQQLAAMLWRYAADVGLLEEENAALESYPDGDRVAGFAREPLRWALGVGILQGSREESLVWLRPGDSSTRAQVAAMLMRFHRGVLLAQPQSTARAPRDPGAPESLTKLWINGHLLKNCPVWEGEPYFSLQTLAEAEGGVYAAGGNLRLTALGHSFYLSDRGDAALLDGAGLRLSRGCLCREGVWYAPARALLAPIGYGELPDPEQGQSFFSYAPASETIPAGVRVVMLRYHCVSDDTWGIESLFMSPSKVEAQIEAMEKLGCSFLNFEDLDKIDQYERPVFLTFDDGYRDNYEELFPILKRHNAKATVFMITRAIGFDRYLTADMMREMADSGLVSFQSHTVTHGGMDSMSRAELEYETAQSQLDIARVTGKAPFVLSFPEARASQLALQTVAEHYRYAVIADGYAWVTGTEPYHLPRFVMPRDLSMERFLTYFE